MIRTKLMKNWKPVIIVGFIASDYEILTEELVTQVKVLYPNGDTEYCEPWEVTRCSESMNFEEQT